MEIRIITINVPESYIKAIKSLTGNKGLYPSRSELIRVAVREFLIQELKVANKFVEFQKNPEPIKETEESEFEIDIDNILGIAERNERMADDIKYKTSFQMDFQKVPTMINPISERSGRVVDFGDRIQIDGKVWNVQ